MAAPLDVCIRGAGIVGRTLALLLARDRLRVGLVEAPGEALRLYVVRAAGTAPPVDADQIAAHCRAALTAYKVPRQIVFVEALPKSSVGKILRRELRDMA